MVDRIYNFNPGPATMPLEVLQRAGRDIVNYQETGIGILEMSHRAKEFMAIADAAELNLRTLMNVWNTIRSIS